MVAYPDDPAPSIPLVAIGPDVDLEQYTPTQLDRGAHRLLLDLAERCLDDNDAAGARLFLRMAKRLRRQ